MISALATQRERAGTGAAFPVPARHAQGRVAREFEYVRLGNLPAGAKRRPTNQSAMNGPSQLPLADCFTRNSSQPLHYSSGKTADGFKFRVMARHPDLSAMTGGGQDFLPCSPPFSFKEVDNTHSVSPSHDVAVVSVEEKMDCVRAKELPIVEIEAAREIHERLIVRLMVAPGDSAGAMYRAEAAFGLSYHCQKNLRHQHRASAEFVARLHAVWRCVLEQSIQRDVAELLRTEAAQ